MTNETTAEGRAKAAAQEGAEPANGGSAETCDVGEVLTELETNPQSGLTQDEAEKRLAKHGANLIEEEERSVLGKLLAYFWGPIPWMIEIAAVLSLVARDWVDFAIIVVMLLINAGVGFFEEYRADNAIAVLKQTLALSARVRRDGAWRTVPARELVPGDIIQVRLGNIIPADVKLVDGDYLSVDQSALTGELLPVDKKAGDIAYSGSIARAGEMQAVVTETGAKTYFGRTAKLVESAGATSHFQKAVLKIGNFLIISTLGLVALIVTVAFFRHDPVVETIVFALILTVAAIPVALPAVLSVTMAVGAVTLARQKAIVSRLVAIEEMAGMDILCSDKTGTLTQNRLAVGEPEIVEATDAEELMLSAALASKREAEDDPIDSAILKEAGLKEAGDASDLEAYRVVSFKPFDPVRKRAEAEIETDGQKFSVAKGAPQVILELAETDAAMRERIDGATDALAKRGYRALGVARREAGGAWRFLGLLPLFDPPRDDSAETIEQAQAKGLDIRMLTGDHQAIARETARQLHLGTNIIAASEIFPEGGAEHDGERIEAADGFAQVFPEHKFKIVKELQAHGHIVGMTGDGVNDAPALKQADIGIAVSGATDAARAAADLVLTAPGLSVIITAIEEARRIFERMTSYAVFRIAETIRVLLFMTLSILIFDFYPVTAVMIVLLAILNDFPIMMIAYDNVLVAQRPVRWDMWRVLIMSTFLGLTGVIASFGLFLIAENYLELPRDVIQTLVFLKLLVAGHLTIYLTRNTGAFWDRPWPAMKLFVSAEATQILGTLAAVYGWFVTPIGWRYALAVWAYALVWFLINSALKSLVQRMIDSGGARHARHLQRVQTSMHAHGHLK